MSDASLLHQLRDLLCPQRLTQIVDIGANPIEGPPPYQALIDSGLGFVTGFEPQKDALAELIAEQAPNTRFLPHAVGDGSEKVLNICDHSGWTSTLLPDPASLAVFDAYTGNAAVIDSARIPTTRLDDVAEIKQIDLLKIDIQGGEMDVFRHGKVRLAGTAFIQTEVSFVPLYQDQPPIGEIDLELRAQGFIPHSMGPPKQAIISPFMLGGDPWRTINQLIEADMAYVRDFRRPEMIDDEQLRHMCIIAHGCYQSFDLAYRCVLLLRERGAIAGDAPGRYLDIANQEIAQLG